MEKEKQGYLPKKKAMIICTAQHCRIYKSYMPDKKESTVVSKCSYVVFLLRRMGALFQLVHEFPCTQLICM
jgi:hypothetical protein